MIECTCHRETGTNHEQCCGHDEGRDPDCPFHGDGSGPQSHLVDNRIAEAP
jgi:hypothetical protein